MNSTKSTKENGQISSLSYAKACWCLPKACMHAVLESFKSLKAHVCHKVTWRPAWGKGAKSRLSKLSDEFTLDLFSDIKAIYKHQNPQQPHKILNNYLHEYVQYGEDVRSVSEVEGRLLRETQERKTGTDDWFNQSRITVSSRAQGEQRQWGKVRQEIWGVIQ